jgi:hypothetical protein
MHSLTNTGTFKNMVMGFLVNVYIKRWKGWCKRMPVRVILPQKMILQVFLNYDYDNIMMNFVQLFGIVDHYGISFGFMRNTINRMF